MFQGELAFIAAKEDKPPGREVWLERSTDTLQEAIRLAALDPQYDLDMAKLLQYWGTWLKDKDPSLAQRKWRKAVKYWARAVRLNPRSPDLHNEFGRFQHHLERHAEAERLYRRSLEIDPNFAETHAFLSDLYRDLGQASLAKGNRARARDYSSRALASYRRAIEIKPDLEPSLKKLREAIERLEEVGSESE
jgi:tetratricopeptide (TPR) repeat protein